MSEKNRCLECHSLTANPKFCKRSCAAKFNNRKSPKRSPEGTCGDCGVAISASRSYCPECREKRQHSSTTTPVQMREVTVFTASSMSLPADSRVGAFLDVFESLAQSQPRYLPSSDWTRHVQFVQLFRKFSHELPGYHRNRTLVSAVDFPLNLLEWVLRRWLESAVSTATAHPLAATFAWETADVLLSHLRGHRHWGIERGHEFEIRAMSEGETEREFREDQQLKKELTQNILGGLEVKAELPSSVEIQFYDRVVDRGHGFVRFRIERCHRSQNAYDQYELKFAGGAWEPFDLSERFEFFGHVLMRPSEDLSPRPGSDHDFHLAERPEKGDRWAAAYLPIRWITHCEAYTDGQWSMRPLAEQWNSFSGVNADSEEFPNNGLKLFDGNVPGTEV